MIYLFIPKLCNLSAVLQFLNTVYKYFGHTELKYIFLQPLFFILRCLQIFSGRSVQLGNRRIYVSLGILDAEYIHLYSSILANYEPLPAICNAKQVECDRRFGLSSILDAFLLWSLREVYCVQRYRSRSLFPSDSCSDTSANIPSSLKHDYRMTTA